MPTAEVKRCLVSVYHLARKSAKLSLSSLLLGAIANKATSPDPSDWLCSVSSLSACFLRTRFVMSFAKDKGQLQTPRPYSLCIQHIRQNFWAQIIFGPYRRPLTLTHLLVSTRGFSRIWCSNVCTTARFPRMLQKL